VYAFSPSGSFIRSYSGGPAFSNATGVAFDPEGRMYAAQSVTNNVLRFDTATGTSLGAFAAGGGLSIPIGMIFAPDGNLLVGSFGNDSVIKYNRLSGASMGVFIAAGSGGLDGTHNFAYMPVPSPSAFALVLAGLAIARRRRA